MIPQAVLVKLATLGLDGDQAEAVAEMLSAVEAATKGESATAIEARRANDRERKARQRHVKSREVTCENGTSRDPSPPKEKSPTPPKEITPPTKTEPNGSYTRDFEEFWTIWKSVASSTGKFEAFKAWKARKPAEREQASRLAADYFRRWRAEHPEASPLHAATYLNKRRWLDMLDDAEPVGDLFVAQSEPNFLPLRGRYRSEHGADPPPAVQDGASGALFPAAWVIASRASMGRQANG